MGYVVRMPQLGMSMDEGTVVEWVVGEGEPVAADEVIAIVESEKTSSEVEAREGGVLRQAVVGAGETVAPGDSIGIVAGPEEDLAPYEADIDGATGGESPDGATGGESPDAAPEEASREPGAEASTTPSGATADGPDRDDTEPASEDGRPPDSDPAGTAADSADGVGTDDSAVRATPGARDLAAEAGVDPAAVAGTGPGGAVTERDVRRHAETMEEAAASDDRPDEAAMEEAAASDDRPDDTTDDADATDRPEPTEPLDRDAGATGVRASPGARLVATERGVDVADVDGTGPEGAVVEADVRAHLPSGGGTGEDGALEDATAPPADDGPAASPGRAGGTRPGDAGPATVTVDRIEAPTATQQTVADRLAESYRSAVHVTLNRTVETTALDDVLDAAGTLGVDVSLNDLLCKAVGDALVAHPRLNAHYEDGEHRLIEEINVAIAVDAAGDLLTPVVPDVPGKDATEVAATRATLIDRVRAGDHDADDLAGGTFTVSNLGGFGVDHFDPIINPPQVAILGVGRKRPGGMTLSLTFDHRVVNGAGAARFLGTLADHLTDAGTLAGYVGSND